MSLTHLFFDADYRLLPIDQWPGAPGEDAAAQA